MKREKLQTQMIERVAGLAMKLGGRRLSDYGAARSRHDFTQHQLMACLILRAYLKTTYGAGWNCWPSARICGPPWV
jgi:hypothetical protein